MFYRWIRSLALSLAVLAAAGLPAHADGPLDDHFSGTTLDKKWTVNDVNPAQPGGAVVKNGTLVMTDYGAGSGSMDTVLFVSQSLNGDFIATLKILSVPGTGDDASAGLMVRQSADPGSPMVFVMVDLIDWREGVKMRSRINSGDSYQEVAKTTNYQLPVWIRIVRSGDAFLGYRSEDGSAFTLIGSTRVPMTDPVLVGAASWANNGGANGGFLPGVGTVTDFAETTPPAGGRILATVNDDQGNPVPGAGVLVKDSSGKVVAATVGPRARGDSSSVSLVQMNFVPETIVPFVPPGSYTLTPIALGFDSGGDMPVTITAGKDTTATLTLKALPTQSLASGSLPMGSKGWVVKPDVDSTEGGTRAADYKAVDYVEDASWKSVTVPGDLSGGNPVHANSYFWYRGHVTLPAGWQASYGTRDLVLTVPAFADAGTSQIAWNGVPIGGGIDTDPYVLVVPNSAVHWTGDNVIAIQGRASKGSAGMMGSAPALSIGGPAAGVISGTVRAIGAHKLINPVSWVRVLASSPSSAWGPFSKFMDSKNDGTYSLSGLPPGTYTVQVLPRQDRVSQPAPAQITVAAGATGPEDFTVSFLPTLDLVKENGYQWLSVSTGAFDANDFMQDHSVVNDPETGFTPWDVSNKNGDWNAFTTDEHIYGWLRLHVKLPADWKVTYGSDDLRFWWFNWDNDEVSYWNGTPIGGLGNWRPETGVPGGWVGSFYQNHRDYTVPNKLVNWDGDNVIALHVYQSVGDAGFSLWRPRVTPIVPPTPVTPIMPPAQAMLGDVTRDGKVNVADATLTLRAALKLTVLSVKQTTAADVNKDGKVNVADATLILRFALGLITAFPGQP